MKHRTAHLEWSDALLCLVFIITTPHERENKQKIRSFNNVTLDRGQILHRENGHDQEGVLPCVHLTAQSATIPPWTLH